MTTREKGKNDVGGKLPKNNTFSTQNLKTNASFDGWATKQGGSHKSWKRRYFLLVNDSGGKSADLYYFKSDKAKSATGVIKINERSTVKQTDLKGKKVIAVDTGSIGARTYYMHCNTPQEQEKMCKSINDKILSFKTKPTESKTTSIVPSNSSGSTGSVASTSTPSTAKPAAAPANDGIKFALDSAKNAIPFLSTETGEDRILEFWQIWTESIPSNASDVDVTLVMTADMTQLSWRVFGPQNVLIQEMVDFFWNVGAPEQEIDRLNDVGGLINPLTIGSWIDMSTKGGMDGGWVFPVTVGMVDALKACDEGPSLAKLSEWTRVQHIQECVTVGRDMGASPPRQTEIRFPIVADNFEGRLAKAMSAYEEFGFPVLPEMYVSVLREWNPVSMELSVITSSEGFVRIGMILPDPDKKVVTQLCNNSAANPTLQMNFQGKMKIGRPAAVEFQYLMESFGYGVYNEGLNVVFHYKLDPHMAK